MSDRFKLYLPAGAVDGLTQDGKSILEVCAAMHPGECPLEVWEAPLKPGQPARFIGIADAPDSGNRRTCDGQPVAQPNAETP